MPGGFSMLEIGTGRKVDGSTLLMKHNTDPEKFIPYVISINGKRDPGLRGGNHHTTPMVKVVM